MLDVPLVIWVNSPPHVESGAFAYLAEHWPGGVKIAVLGELRAERSAMGWGAGSIEDILLPRGEMTLGVFCRVVMDSNPDALHLVAGLTGVAGKALSEIIREAGPRKVAVFSEKPCVYGPWPKRLARLLLQPLRYRWLVRRYRGHVGLMLPLGTAGVRRFQRYGWRRDGMAPFMYCPALRDRHPSVDAQNSPVRFMYVGRMTRFTKGTDVLMEAVERLHGDWRLTLVGGHGDIVDGVIAWAADRPNVEHIGATLPEDVTRLISEHDVCVVPSRVDGWNVVVNEAIYAGRGVIVTDTAGSDELVSSSGAGMVVDHGSVKALASAMQRVIDDPSLARTWADRAVAYAPLISPDTVGKYLLDLLDTMTKGTVSFSSRAPWLRTNGIDGREVEQE